MYRTKSRAQMCILLRVSKAFLLLLPCWYNASDLLKLSFTKSKVQLGNTVTLETSIDLFYHNTGFLPTSFNSNVSQCFYLFILFQAV